MKPLKNTSAKNFGKQQSASEGKSCAKTIHITLVSEKERNIYRIPTYGYILP